MKKISLFTLCVMFIVMITGCASGDESRKYALLIGINDYSESGFESLRGSVNDTRLIKDLLTMPRFGFESGNISVLLNKEATHSKILGAFEDLRGKIQSGDMIYIHYSGHGSRVLAVDDSKKHKGGYHTTLVPYGARTGNYPASGVKTFLYDLDDYDILDDELETALFNLSTKTPDIVFVADSCHSGTITRGTENMATRGIAVDNRLYPKNTMSPLPEDAKRVWIAVGAALDSEKAIEHRGDDGLVYGAFTWFWAKALQAGRSTDTWQTVYERTMALMRSAAISQTPMLEGNTWMKVTGGISEEEPGYFSVMEVISSGKVKLNAGILSGISVGSEFQPPNAKENEVNTVLTVQNVEANSCTANVRGDPVTIGDIVTLTKWRPVFERIKIAIQSDFASDEALASTLAGLFENDNLAAYELVDSPAVSRLVLWICRPRVDEKGEVVLRKDSGLPESDEGAIAQVWIMDPSQASLYGGQENLKILLNEEGIAILSRNLVRIAKLYALRNMQFPGDGFENLSVKYKLFVTATDTEWDDIQEGERVELPLPQKKWKLNRIVTADGTDVWRSPEEQILALLVQNNSRQSYYIYSINATPEANISAFLPPDKRIFNTEVPPGETRDFSDISVLFLEDNQEYVRVIAAISPINIHVLSQSAFETTARSENNIIEEMLHETIYRTRGNAGSFTISPYDLISKATLFLKKEYTK